MTFHIYDLWRPLVCCAALMMAAGCTTQPLRTYKPDKANIEILQSPAVPGLAMGSFVSAMSNDQENSSATQLPVRAVRLVSGIGESFADYLREAWVTELRAARKYQTDGEYSLSGELKESLVDGWSFSEGKAALGSTLALRRRGVVVYCRHKRVQQVWESTWLAEVAIPRAIDNYTSLYGKLIQAFLTDTDFMSALQGNQISGEQTTCSL